jgi:hypothetical protein
VKHDLLRKPVPTFWDHALAAYRGSVGSGPENRTLLSRLMRPDGSPDRYPHQVVRGFHSLLVEHDPFRKPLHTFRDHALACRWSGRQKIWRRTEVLIPTPEGAIPLRTGAGRSPGSFSNWSGRQRGGGVRYRAPHVAVLTVFKTGPAPRWLRLRTWLSLGDSNSVPLVPETSALFQMS